MQSIKKVLCQNSKQKEIRVHYAKNSHYSISAAMFDFQDEEQVTIDDSLRNKEDVEDDPEAHQKGYRFKRRNNHTDLLFGFATLFYLHLILNIYYYLLDITTTTTHFPSPLPAQHHFQKN